MLHPSRINFLRYWKIARGSTLEFCTPVHNSLHCLFVECVSKKSDKITGKRFLFRNPVILFARNDKTDILREGNFLIFL